MLEVILTILVLFVAFYLIKLLFQAVWFAIKMGFKLTIWGLPICMTIVLSALGVVYLIPCILVGVGYYVLLYKISSAIKYKKATRNTV